tara:strand:+ start:2905 stop:3129 length:225 start_codon:yes stop_codon:yes gene_type:complete
MKYILLLLILASCAAKQPEVKTKPDAISIFDGSMSRVLGCIFAPQECENIKQEERLQQQREITRELEELDKEEK